MRIFSYCLEEEGANVKRIIAQVLKKKEEKTAKTSLKMYAKIESSIGKSLPNMYFNGP